MLQQPLLYLSLYFKQHRDEYYRLLDTARRDGDWEARLDFFLEGVTQTAGGAVDTVHRLLALFRKDDERIQALGRGTANTLRIFSVLKARPIANINELARHTGVSYPTAAKTVEALIKLGIVRELTGRRRHRVFAYDRYLTVLNEGTEPL